MAQRKAALIMLTSTPKIRATVFMTQRLGHVGIRHKTQSRTADHVPACSLGRPRCGMQEAATGLVPWRKASRVQCLVVLVEIPIHPN